MAGILMSLLLERVCEIFVEMENLRTEMVYRTPGKEMTAPPLDEMMYKPHGPQ